MPSTKFAAPDVFGAVTNPKTTEVFDTYWKFATKRQEVFFRRFNQESEPWTDDEIIQQHKFTNAYRASDRVSQYLIKEVIYKGNQSPNELLFRIILFKLFNKIETWELLKRKFGSIAYSEYSFDLYDEVLSSAIENGQRIYSAAYIMPSGSKLFLTNRKHRAHLKLLESMMSDNLANKIAEADSLKSCYELLLAYPMVGPFLAYQYAIDINYSDLCHFDEMEFVVPGPGALNGIKKCFLSTGDYSEADIIRWVTERQNDEFDRLGIQFQDLWGRSLQLIDCQNLFCEVDKYSRIKHPEYNHLTNRSRIKQSFKATESYLTPWFPPKWGINHLIPAKERKS